MDINTQGKISADDQDDKKASPLIPVLVTILVVVVILAASSLYFMSKQDISNETKDPFADLQGQIHLTLAPEEGDRGGRELADTNEYVFDIRSQELNELIPIDDSVKITSDTASDGRIAYMATPYDSDAPEENYFPASETLQLYTYDPSTERIQKITERPDLGKRQPVWSPDGSKIAFYSIEREMLFDTVDGVEVRNENEIPTIPNQRSIYITDLNGNIKFIANGVQPFWSPSGKYIIYIGNDGLYRYDTDSGNVKLVYDFGGISVTSFMKFGLSQDKSMLAWSHPKGNHVSVFNIISWDPFEVLSLERIPIRGYAAAYWPTFSPDNRFVVFQWIDSNQASDTFFDFQLVVYDRETGQRKTLLDLEPYLFLASFINDWTY